MFNIGRRNKAALKLFIFVFLISLYSLSRNCVPDDYCDPDPVYGGCSDVCEYSWPGWWPILGRTIGYYFLVGIGGYIAKDMFLDEKD